jgi:hypothetical protein
MTLTAPEGKSVWLAVRQTGPLGDDRMGPYVHITSPVYEWYHGVGHGKKDSKAHWGPNTLPRGRFTFKADAADRSGVAKVEFYLNNGQLIGTDTEAPYECEHEIKGTFCQYVYAVAYDRMGNKRRSFEVPFGDGTLGPSLVEK